MIKQLCSIVCQWCARVHVCVCMCVWGVGGEWGGWGCWGEFYSTDFFFEVDYLAITAQ